ncbi:MAG: preprotein translocase subunit SecA, partial [Christensenellaceae bacterium]|nr:preprotein translocase subunit SecA [Christensenellaceae bacterium]
WMGKLYSYLGYTVGLVTREKTPSEKKAAYNCDIVYSTNNELGFDYLRDNMTVYRENMMQRELAYAIVDEVDSILIDEARTPHIISGQGDKSTELYNITDRFVKKLRIEDDYVVDEKQRTANLTEAGTTKAEEFFGVENFSDIENTELNHHVYQALKANYIFRRDIDYVVQNGEVMIVDEFTGRLMVGRRYSEGLHQAIEAKEGVEVLRESKTLATITFQNFFRMYEKLSGMTGTAKTEENELQGIYGLSVVEIPTHKPMIREDLNDRIYPTVAAKFNAVVEDIVAIHATGQPLLVGTVSVENSEKLSAMLKRRGIPHEVLNAKYHEKEAQIVAQAGKYGAVTIATNMAGRGTDILLGGNPDFLARKEMQRLEYTEEMILDAISHAETKDEEVLAARKVYQDLLAKYKIETDAEHEKVVNAGGLFIIGTERHESRRIDNQLRGRSGRQGDPGKSRFYIALEDDLMRLFGGERIKMIMERLSGGEELNLEYGMMTKQIENAQKRIEERNFEIRGSVLKYDDVMNQQREVIYSQRRSVLMGEDISENISSMLDDVIGDITDTYCPGNLYPEEWDRNALMFALNDVIPGFADPFGNIDITSLTAAKAKDRILSLAHQYYSLKEKELTEQGADMREAERIVLLRSVDEHWMAHIDDMDQLKQGIGLRAYAQTDPVVAFRKESSEIFDEMIFSITRETIRRLFRVTVKTRLERKEAAKPTHTSHGEDEQPRTIKRSAPKVGRNDPCPCGSGKKYKNCCGRE